MKNTKYIIVGLVLLTAIAIIYFINKDKEESLLKNLDTSNVEVKNTSAIGGVTSLLGGLLAKSAGATTTGSTTTK